MIRAVRAVLNAPGEYFRTGRLLANGELPGAARPASPRIRNRAPVDEAVCGPLNPKSNFLLQSYFYPQKDPNYEEMDETSDSALSDTGSEAEVNLVCQNRFWLCNRFRFINRIFLLILERK